MSELVTYTPPSAGELEQTWLLADRFSRTEFVPTALRGKPEAVMACMLAGRELGIGPMQALQKIHIIQGRPTLSAELMASLVRRAGHRLRTIESTASTATVEGARHDDPDAPEKITFTIEDAKRAGLVGKDVWKAYPTAMLWARAVSALCRRLFPDVLAGMSYTREEVEGGGSTETTWGAPEVEQEDPGPADSDPNPVRRTGPTATQMRQAQAEATRTRQRADMSVLTNEQISRLRSRDDARALVERQPDEFKHVLLNQFNHEDEWRVFWKDASLASWKDHLRDAVAEMSDPGPAGPPARPGADTQSDPVLQGEGEAGSDPLTDGDDDGR